MELQPIGALLDPKSPKDILYETVAAVAVADLPRKFSSRKDQSPVASQKYGSCCGFARKSACEYHRKIDLGVDEKLSGRFYYGQAKNIDGQPDEQGTYPRITIAVSYGKGAVLDKDFSNSNPPSPTHADYIKAPADEITEGAIQRVMAGGFVRVTNLQELKQALVEYGIVEITVSVYTQFDNPENDGFIPWAAQRSDRGRHRIICTGYDDDFRGVGAIEVKNNWGTNWGDDGYGYIAYDYEGEGATPCMDMWVDVPADVVSAELTSGAPISIGYPVEGNPFITQAFGARPEYYAKYGMKGHNGIDFRTRDTNKKIIACDDGEIILAGNDGSYGQAVRIKHAWGMSIYAHNSQIVVPLYENDGSPKKVTRGQQIAVAGATGDTGTPPAEHCHFGIRINGVKNAGYFDWVNPAPYFGKATMTKYFKVNQAGKLGILILEGFSGTLLFENDFTEYNQLLQITGGTASAPTINIPAGKLFKINDHGKLGIMVVEGFSAAILFENDFAEYTKLLQLVAMPNDAITVQIP